MARSLSTARRSDQRGVAHVVKAHPGLIGFARDLRAAWTGRATALEGSPSHIGLGTFCHTAEALRATGLRRWSGPFDWIFSHPGMIADCLEDGFAAFLDRRHHESLPSGALPSGSTRGGRHRLYEERYGLPALFNHHDPAAQEADRRRFERAVARFRSALEGGHNVFWMLSEVAWPMAEMARLQAALARFPHRHTLVVLTAVAGEGELGGDTGSENLAGETNLRPHAEVPADGRPRSTLPGFVSFEAPLRGAPQDEEVGSSRSSFLDLTLRTASRSRGLGFADPADDALLAATLRRIAGDLARQGRAVL